MSKYFFTSDLHLGHANIIKYCVRPFKDITNMNATLIANWNSRVKEEDTVFHVGDFCFKNSSEAKGEGQKIHANSWTKLLNGNKIFIKGNHDRNNSVSTIIHNLVINYGPHTINLVHCPQDASFDYKLNFVGHIHQNWKFQRLFAQKVIDISFPREVTYTDLINVGVDVWRFMPVTFEEIYREYRSWKNTVSDQP